MNRLAHRVTRIAEQQRPTVVQRILWRARSCPPAEVRETLMEALTGLDQVTFNVVLDQLTDAELEILAGRPGLMAWLDNLPLHELEALASGDQVALRQCEQAWHREKGERKYV